MARRSVDMKRLSDAAETLAAADEPPAVALAAAEGWLAAVRSRANFLQAAPTTQQGIPFIR